MVKQTKVDGLGSLLFYIVLIINLIIHLVSVYFFGNTAAIFTDLYTVKYLIAAIIISPFVSIFTYLISKNFSIKVIENNEK